MLQIKFISRRLLLLARIVWQPWMQRNIWTAKKASQLKIMGKVLGIIYRIKKGFESTGELWEEMEKCTVRSMVPQVYVDDCYIGGFDDLIALERKGQLSKKLKLA